VFVIRFVSVFMSVCARERERERARDRDIHMCDMPSLNIPDTHDSFVFVT